MNLCKNNSFKKPHVYVVIVKGCAQGREKRKNLQICFKRLVMTPPRSRARLNCLVKPPPEAVSCFRCLVKRQKSAGWSFKSLVTARKSPGWRLSGLVMPCPKEMGQYTFGYNIGPENKSAPMKFIYPPTSTSMPCLLKMWMARSISSSEGSAISNSS